MNKVKSFFMSSFLLIVVFAIALVATLLYKANERANVKSYIFQMSNFANQRVGSLQDINDISAIDLRNKLIKKYVSEYFKVIPGEQDVTNRPVLENLGQKAFEQWKKGEAKTIADMSARKIFRKVHVDDAGIAMVSKQDNPDYTSTDIAPKVYYEVRYSMYTWNDSNILELTPVYEQGTVYIEAKFKTGIKPDISVRKHLEQGLDPSGLFKFEVTNVGNKEFL